MELTPRQQSVLDVIRDHYRRFGFSPTVREICERLGLAGPAGVHRVLRVLEDKGVIRSEPGKKRCWQPVLRPDVRDMPVAGRIAAGAPLDVWARPDERLPVAPELYGHRDCFALLVTGDSMIGAHIQDGDLAVIRPQPDVDSGEIAAVMIAGILPEATLKVVRKTRYTLELLAVNPDYPPLVFAGAEQARVGIVGKYVGLIRLSEW
ncbi:MAG: transcriptional repressor LexA [Desulfosudaceae bacterium]